MEGEYDIFKDPSFKPAAKLAQGTSPLLNRYLRSELQFKTDLLYQGPLGGGLPQGISINRRFQRTPAEGAPAGASGRGGAAGAAGAAVPQVPQVRLLRLAQLARRTTPYRRFAAR